MKDSINRNFPRLFEKIRRLRLFFTRLTIKAFRFISDIYESLSNQKSTVNEIKTKTGWSIVIITNGKANDFLHQAIKSINDELVNTPFEIIVVGPKSLSTERFDCQIKHIPYSELNISPGWITKKKNLGVAAAIYDKVVLSHDYITFVPGWKKGYDEFSQDFDVCMNKIVNTDNSTRWKDWMAYYPGVGFALLPYDSLLMDYQYISGTYFVVKRNFYAKYPLNEKLRWNEAEDAEWSSRIRNITKFKMNTKSTVRLLKYKPLPNELITNGEKIINILKKNYGTIQK